VAIHEFLMFGGTAFTQVVLPRGQVNAPERNT
jgi:hypothetical protein